MHTNNVYDKRSAAPVLTQIFYKYADETISDDQLRRILQPVVNMIQTGKFDSPHMHNKQLSEKNKLLESTVVSPPQSLNSYIYQIYGYVFLLNKGIMGIKVMLVDAHQQKVVDMAVTDKNGKYSFTGFPKAIYRLKVELPLALSKDSNIDADGWVAVDGKKEILLGAGTEEMTIKVDIRI